MHFGSEYRLMVMILKYILPPVHWYVWLIHCPFGTQKQCTIPLYDSVRWHNMYKSFLASIMASATYGPSACGLSPRTLLALPGRYTILFPVPVTSITITDQFLWFLAYGSLPFEGRKVSQRC